MCIHHEIVTVNCLNCTTVLTLLNHSFFQDVVKLGDHRKALSASSLLEYLNPIFIILRYYIYLTTVYVTMLKCNKHFYFLIAVLHVFSFHINRPRSHPNGFFSCYVYERRKLLQNNRSRPSPVLTRIYLT